MFLSSSRVKCFSENSALTYEVMKRIFWSASFRFLLSVESSFFLSSVSNLLDTSLCLKSGYFFHFSISMALLFINRFHTNAFSTYCIPNTVLGTRNEQKPMVLIDLIF